MTRWLGPLALVAAIAAVVWVARVTGADCGDFDARTWRERPGERNRLAESLVECGRLQRLRPAEVRALLGRPQTRDRRSWAYVLRRGRLVGPVVYGRGVESLAIGFGADGRVARVREVQEPVSGGYD